MNNNYNIIDFFNINLDNISKLEEGDKIYVKDNIITKDNSYIFQGLWRYYNNISRKDAIYLINKLLIDIEIYFNSIYLKYSDKDNNNILILNKISNSDINHFINIISKLELSIKGINNIKLTYNNDDNIAIEIDKIISKINDLIINFNNMINFK